MASYDGRSINKLQNGAIPSVLKMGKIRNMQFVGSLILNMRTNFLDDDIIIVTSADNRTQPICVLFVPSACCRNSQVINSIRTILLFFFYRPTSKFAQTLVPSVNKLYSECLMQITML